MPHYRAGTESPEHVLDSALAPVLAQLQALEPLIYAANDGKPRAHFEQLLAPEFWEVGASGRPYSRSFVLGVLDERQRQPFSQAWQATGFHLQEIAPSLYLLSYTLQQPTRLSRRATIWRQVGQGWQMVYHQGTVVAEGEGVAGQGAP
jgi:hypothetical protein